MNISVLVTTYNSGKYLKSSIQSILNQTYSKYEIVIVDDGSDDNTKEIVDLFTDDRIHYYYIEHIGRTAALNYGLKKCENDWIALLDADDICLPNRLDEYSKLGRLEENTIIVSWVKYFDESKKIIYSVRPSIIDSNLKEQIRLHGIFSYCALYNKKFILSHGGYDQNLRLAEDYDLWLRILDHSIIIVLPLYLTLIRFRSVSLTNLNYKITAETNYVIQKKHLFKQIDYINETDLLYLGWREYFYGDKDRSRYYWSQYGLRIFLHPRAIIAFLLSFINEDLHVKIKKYRVRLRLENKLYDILMMNKSYNNLLSKYD